MGRTVISETMLDKLEASLKECIHAKVISRSQAVMHIKPQMNGVSMGWLAVAMEKLRLKRRSTVCCSKKITPIRSL